jgi:hypothetical protein
MATIRRQPELAAAALLLFASYGFFVQGGGWNQAVRVDLAWAIVEQGSLSIDSYVANTGDWALFEGHYYSAKAPGVSLLAVPLYLLMRGLALLLGLDPSSAAGRATSGQLLSWIIGGGATAALAWLVGLASDRWYGAGRQARLFVTLLFGLATLAFPMATVLMGHSVAALAGVGALLLAMGSGGRTARPGWAGLLGGLAVALEYQAVIYLVVAGLLVAWRLRSPRSLLILVAGAALPALVVAAYHQACFGHPLTTGYRFHADMFRFPDQEVFLGLLGVPHLERLWAISFGAKRGLFLLYPACLLGPVGAVLLWRRRASRPALLASAVVVAWFFLLNASYPNWDGGYCSGPRYLTPALPVLVAPAVALLVTRGRLPALVLAVLSGALATAITLVNPQGPFQVDSLLGAYILPALADGRVADNLFLWWPQWQPNSPQAAAAAATNLGELLGLRGLASGLPLLALWVVGGLVLRRLLGRIESSDPGATHPEPPGQEAERSQR